VPGARFDVIKGAAHFTIGKQPERCMLALIEFCYMAVRQAAGR
jgi:hypothetical protein